MVRGVTVLICIKPRYYPIPKCFSSRQMNKLTVQRQSNVNNLQNMPCESQAVVLIKYRLTFSSSTFRKCRSEQEKLKEEESKQVRMQMSYILFSYHYYVHLIILFKFEKKDLSSSTNQIHS